MFRHLLAVTALLAPLHPAAAQAAPVTVFVVRHAEKGPEPNDPPLSAEGQARASALARVLMDANVTAFFATEFKRTRQTVSPLAAGVQGIPTLIPAVRTDSLVGRLRALPPGTRALVASHSNLVHVIVERLSGVRIPPLTDLEYDRLVVVTLGADGKGEAVVLRYGQP